MRPRAIVEVESGPTLVIVKGVIDREEARGVLESAMYRAAMYTGTLEGHEATKIIGKWLESAIAAEGGSQ